MGFALIPPPAFVVKGCITENSIATSSTLLLEVENIHTNKEDHWIFIGPDWFKLVRNTKYQSEKLYKRFFSRHDQFCAKKCIIVKSEQSEKRLTDVQTAKYIYQTL